MKQVTMKEVFNTVVAPMRVVQWLSCLFVVLLLNSQGSLCESSPSNSYTSLSVTTENGVVEGFLDSGSGWSARTFLGIPFATPPVGNLRFAAPQPPANYTLLEAKTYAPACLQIPVTFLGGNVQTSEDCLYLNVFTPPEVNEPLPVFFWIYGGDFIFGWTSDYPGGQLADTQNMIVVTISYRLAVFGFMAVDELLGQPLNAGILDQQMALKWVYNNIAAFGGDPSRITIAGESAGGASTSFHLLLQDSWPYYRAAILESPGPWAYYNLTAQVELSVAWGVKVGCEMNNGSLLACLRAWQPTELDFVDPLFSKFLPFVDNQLIVAQPAALYKEGKFKQVPVMMGTNLYEGNFFALLFLGELPDIPVTNSHYENKVNSTFGIFAPYVLEWYNSVRETQGNWKAFSDAVADAALDCGAIILSQTLATQSQFPVYRYLFVHTPTLWSLRDLNATHITELPFIWDHPEILLIPLLTPEEMKLSRTMQSFWGNFVYNMNPNPTSDKSLWVPYTEPDPVALILDVGDIKDYTTINKPRCTLWEPLLMKGL